MSVADEKGFDGVGVGRRFNKRFHKAKFLPALCQSDALSSAHVCNLESQKS